MPTPEQNQSETPADPWPTNQELKDIALSQKPKGLKVHVYAGPEDRKKILKAYIREITWGSGIDGYNNAKKEAIKGFDEFVGRQLTALPPMRKGDACFVNLSLLTQPEEFKKSMRLMSIDRPSAKLLARLAAAHEGFHCTQLGTEMDFSSMAGRECEADIAVSADALNAAYLSKDEKKIKIAKEAVNTLMIIRLANTETMKSLYIPSAAGLDHLLSMKPQELIDGMNKNRKNFIIQEKGVAMAIVMHTAGQAFRQKFREQNAKD
jgi:hypothetical protein